MLEDVSRRAFLCGAAALASVPAVASLPDLGFLSAAPAIDEDAVHIVRVVNDTMAPAYEKGEQVYFWPARAPRAGEDAVFQLRGESDPRFYLYRLIDWDDETVTVRQFSPAKDNTISRSEILSAGRVIRSEDLM
jgi:phage repressor protein C with HTH and peptisase S24 domain